MSKPIVFLDAETTGTDICKDRIVQLCIWKLDYDFKELEPIKVRLINPTIPIPPASTEVHKITDDMVKDAPVFSSIAKSLFDSLQGCDIGGFNVIGFDVPLLSEEFARCNIDWPGDDVSYYDAFRVFVKKETRDLAGAARFYLSKEHEGAHDARIDVKMTVQVAAKQMLTYPDIAEMQADEVSKFCIGKNALDLAGKILLNDQGEAVYGFGKDTGKTIRDNPGYAKWMLKESFPANTKKVLNKILGNG